MKNVPTGLNGLKSKADKLDVDILVLLPVDFSKLSDVVKNDVVKKMYIMLRSNKMKVKQLILLTLLLILLLMQKRIKLNTKYLILLI